MTDQTQQDVEDVLCPRSAYDQHGEPTYFYSKQDHEAAQRLARLVKGREDDGEELTVEWVRSVQPDYLDRDQLADREIWFWGATGHTDIVVIVCNDGLPMVCLSYPGQRCEVHQCETRGDFNRLCSVLGINLKETE